MKAPMRRTRQSMTRDVPVKFHPRSHLKFADETCVPLMERIILQLALRTPRSFSEPRCAQSGSSSISADGGKRPIGKSPRYRSRWAEPPANAGGQKNWEPTSDLRICSGEFVPDKI